MYMNVELIVTVVIGLILLVGLGRIVYNYIQTQDKEDDQFSTPKPAPKKKRGNTGKLRGPYHLSKANKKHDTVDFATRLANMRIKAGMTQKQLAERLGCSKTTVRQWEQRRYKPSRELLEEVARLFNVSTDYLEMETPKITNRGRNTFEDCTFNNHLGM